MIKNLFTKMTWLFCGVYVNILKEHCNNPTNGNKIRLLWLIRTLIKNTCTIIDELEISKINKIKELEEDIKNNKELKYIHLEHSILDDDLTTEERERLEVIEKELLRRGGKLYHKVWD